MSTVKIEVIEGWTHASDGSCFVVRITAPEDRPVALVSFYKREALSMHHLPAGYVYEFRWWRGTRYAWWPKQPGEGPNARASVPIPRNYQPPPEAQWLDCEPEVMT